ncbi:GD18055 [Drosophila simulans]|uniref:GD18055 n=1 Tax=Drosophila simulans TaxID=7240 RepID=B4QY44_DROSI|nr:GD18055 [Drosophila simulans]
MHLTKSPTRSSSSSSSNSSSSSGIAYKFECHSKSKQNSKTGKMAAEARTISKPGHIRDRRLGSLPHILLLAIAVVSLHFESVRSQQTSQFRSQIFAFAVVSESKSMKVALFFGFYSTFFHN